MQWLLFAKLPLLPTRGEPLNWKHHIPMACMYTYPQPYRFSTRRGKSQKEEQRKRRENKIRVILAHFRTVKGLRNCSVAGCALNYRYSWCVSLAWMFSSLQVVLMMVLQNADPRGTEVIHQFEDLCSLVVQPKTGDSLFRKQHVKKKFKSIHIHTYTYAF